MEGVDGPVLMCSMHRLYPMTLVLRTTLWSRVANESPGKERGVLFGTAEVRLSFPLLADGLGAPVVDLAL